MRISAVWLPVSWWEEAKQFYRELLGLTLTHCDDAAGYCAFATSGGPPLFLIRQPAHPTGPSGGAVITFDCPSLSDLRERLIAAGATVEEALQEGAGVRILTFYDPDGNRLEASQPGE